MTRVAALDYAKYGITVNAIFPGYTKTSICGYAPEQAMDFFANDCPAGRMGDPMECAYLALFLASDMSRYITGAAIPVDGALSAGSKNVTSWKMCIRDRNTSSPVPPGTPVYQNNQSSWHALPRCV